MSNLIAKEYKLFEAIKHLLEEGHEFWYAHELATVLEYVQWRNFVKVLDKAMLACRNNWYEIRDHFAEVIKTITMPEDLPTPTKSISNVEINQLKKLKNSPKKLMLDE